MVTHVEGRWRLHVAENTLYDLAADKPLAPFLIMSAREMAIAGRIMVDQSTSESGDMGLDFYMPLILYDVVQDSTDILLVKDTADGCDVALYEKSGQDAAANVLSIFAFDDVPLFFMKALVCHAFMAMVHRDCRRFHLEQTAQDQQGAIPPHATLLVLSVEIPAAWQHLQAGL
jgi:hypothetical protein